MQQCKQNKKMRKKKKEQGCICNIYHSTLSLSLSPLLHWSTTNQNNNILLTGDEKGTQNTYKHTVKNQHAHQKKKRKKESDKKKRGGHDFYTIPRPTTVP